MKILIAPDAFKESMSALVAAEAMAAGILKVFPNAECLIKPMADGGEGTTAALVRATGGRLYPTRVLGPLGHEVEAEYGILGDGHTAVLEMASASGLGLVPSALRNPLLTTTYGTGQLILAALSHPISHLIIGIGGSATNDGGAGMIQALGGKLLRENGDPIGVGGGALRELAQINLSGIDPRLKDLHIQVACDVTNPLIGPTGASAVFGPQKGATPEMVKLLDDNLNHYAQCIQNQLGIAIAHQPGAGAAGGLGAGLMAFLGAELVRGVELVMTYGKVEEAIQAVDLILTGEGSVDGQSGFGKVLDGIGSLALKHRKPVIALAGRIGTGAETMYGRGIQSLLCIVTEPCDLETAIKNGPLNLERTTENLMKVIELSHQIRI